MRQVRKIPSKDTGFDRVDAAFRRVQTASIPRGEVWLGADVLLKAGFKDDLNGHISLVKRLEQDLINIPVAHEPHLNKALGYRYFPVDAIQDLWHWTDFFVMITIDGPFQRLSEKMGLMNVLSAWNRDRKGILNAYEKECEIAMRLLDRCLNYTVHAVVIADDLAGDQSTFLDPLDIARYFSRFYVKAVSEIHKARTYALFHSCGNISKIVPQFIFHGFDGLAATQGHINDLISLKRRFGSQLLLMAGIDGELLEKPILYSSDLSLINQMLKSFFHDSGIVLSSSCGLYSGRFLERLEAIYHFVESQYSAGDLSEASAKDLSILMKKEVFCR